MLNIFLLILGFITIFSYYYFNSHELSFKVFDDWLISGTVIPYTYHATCFIRLYSSGFELLRVLKSRRSQVTISQSVKASGFYYYLVNVSIQRDHQDQGCGSMALLDRDGETRWSFT